MGEPKPVNFRHELKYLISSAEVTMLRTRLSGLISLDAHAKDGHYTIRSLYFDDYDDRCLLENENGTDPREKFRIRIYNGSAERISLECKRKERGMTHKTSCPLTREQTELLRARLQGNRKRELGQAIDRFLRTIPEKQCSLFLRRYWYAESISQIAERYSLKENTVKSILFRTREQLRKFLQKEGVAV